MKNSSCYKSFLLVFIFLCLIHFYTTAQQIEDIKVSGNFKNVPMSVFLKTLEEQCRIKFFYKESWIEPYTVDISIIEIPLVRALNTVFNNHELTYEIYQENAVFISPRRLDSRSGYEGSSEILVIGSLMNSGRYKTATLTGKIYDGKTGDPLPGAVVYDTRLSKGATTNKEGKFQMEMPTGEHFLQISFVGFQSSTVRIRLIENGSHDFELFEETHNIEEVTVLGEEADLPRSQMSMVQMTSNEIKQIPALMGEVDVLKGLTMLAGVQTVSELSSGFNVRGGNTDQNLILVNGSPVFNSSHLFGFLSLINPDVVDDVRLFKGGIPVKFGERISSVMEVDFKDGNNETIQTYGGLGSINSRLAFDGPLAKNKKLTFITGGRISYTNWILKKIPDLDLSRSVTHFYDISGKVTYKFNPHNKVSLMGYSSNDEFSTSSQSVTQYGNLLGNLKVDSRFSEKLYGDLEISHSDYNYRLTDYANNKPEESYFLDNYMKYNSLGYDFNWHPHPQHNVKFGAKTVLNEISPGKVTPVEDISLIETRKLNNEKALEWACYLSEEFEILPQFSISAGLRFSHFSNIGTPVVYIYDEAKPLIPVNVVDSLQFGNNEVSKSYAGLEPRFSLNYDFDINTTVKFNYQRTKQYLFQLSNNAVISPAETWKAADYHLKPLICDQIAVGLENKSWFRNMDFSAEAYFKKLQNLIEYKNGASLIMNEHIETALLPSEGYSYGIELSAKKSTGRLTGYMSYVFSRTMRKTTGNFKEDIFWKGKHYPSIYDKPHDISVTATYNISRRWRLSGNFVFISGRPVTLPELKYTFADETLVYYSERNKYRMPPYHRLDLSLTCDENLRKKRMWKGSWTLAVYNFYGRHNPYSVYYRKAPPGKANNYRRYSLYQLSVIGIPVPSLTYNFKF